MTATGYRRVFAVGAALFLTAQLAAADSVDEVRGLVNTGEYLKAVGITDRATRETPDNENMHVLRIRSLLALGRYAEADAAATSALRLVPQSIRVRWAGRDAALAAGKPDRAKNLVGEIRQLVTVRPGSYRDPVDLIVFANMALSVGADAKDVLDRVISTAQKSDANVREVYQARGDLALSKHDFALAAKAFQEGLKLFPDETEFQYGLARAFETGDRATVINSLQAALKTNPNHVPSLLMMVDYRIDGEDYAEATKLLDQIRAVDPWRPEAWAYSAVIAHLNNETATEKTARDTALKFWTTNPMVDSLIGRKLAEKYRFTEAAAYQRQALVFDADYLPAKAQLATDLLRLGQEKEGWDLVDEVYTKDQYDVEAYNLISLHDTMAKYASISNEDFILRMPPQEAEIYGERTMALLEAARKQLTAKYGIDIAKPTYVEVFGDQKDFAVRTFGMPDVTGFLGVCFGRVVTANGAGANAAHPTNWEAVLWHEFTHVITLQLTQNKMPRWLSEGISVYEETQRDPSWGMPLTPRYREIIVKGEMTPVSNLSAAFLAPPTPERLQFAYFQSEMVVEYIVAKYGVDSLKQILVDLGTGVEINRAIAAHTAPMPTLDKDFVEYAQAKAKALGPKLEWDRPGGDTPGFTLPGTAIVRGGRGAPAAPQQQVTPEWAADHPDNYWGILFRARKALNDKNFAEAKTILTRLVDLYPAQSGPDNAYRLLAAAHRGLGETELERAALIKLADTSDDAIDAYTRLMDIGTAASDWPTVARYSDKYLAVNPLVLTPYRYEARASAELGDAKTAIAANRTMLKLDPPNPAEIHFDLAKLLKAAGDPGGQASCGDGARGRAPLPRGAPTPSRAGEDIPDPGTLRQMKRTGAALFVFAAAGTMALGQYIGQYFGGEGVYIGESIRTAREVPTHSTDIPTWTNPVGFEQDVFTFARIRRDHNGLHPSYNNWQTDSPDSDLGLSYRLQGLTSIRTSPDGRYLRLTDPDLRRYPFIYMVEPGTLYLSDDEILHLRNYLLNGGFLMLDDFWGDSEWRNVEQVFRRVFPNRSFEELPLSHPLYHCVFDITSKGQVPNYRLGEESEFNGGRTWETNHDGDTRTVHHRAIIDDKGRIMVFATHNTDNGDGWEREGESEYFFNNFSQKISYPLGINVVFYAMTH